MPQTVTVRVTPNPALRLELSHSAALHEYLSRETDALAADMRDHAPVRTGAGRQSIGGQVLMTPEGWVGVASWDVAHYYMGFQDRRKPFAEPALQRVRYV
jgi:hypothetical protein